MREGVGNGRTFQAEGKTCTKVLKGGGGSLGSRERSRKPTMMAAGPESTGRVARGRHGESSVFNPNHRGESLRDLACFGLLAVGMVKVDRFGGGVNRTC